MDTHLYLMFLAFIQMISISMVGRARNRDHFGYHAVASVLTGTIWFATFNELVAVNNFSWNIAPAYIFGSTLGSLLGAKLSMRIEQLVGAKV